MAVGARSRQARCGAARAGPDRRFRSSDCRPGGPGPTQYPESQNRARHAVREPTSCPAGHRP